MICNAKPYEGGDSYVFFSYCHEDAALAYPMIERMARKGFRVWYDSGLRPGDDWPEIIAEHLKNSAVCVMLLTENATASHNCKNELNYAVENGKSIVPILYNRVPLSVGMRLQLSSYHQYQCGPLLDDGIVDALSQGEALLKCKGKPDDSIVPHDFDASNRRKETPKGSDLLQRFPSFGGNREPVDGLVTDEARKKAKARGDVLEQGECDATGGDEREIGEPLCEKHRASIQIPDSPELPDEEKYAGENTVVDSPAHDAFDEETIVSHTEIRPVIVRLLDGTCLRGKEGVTKLGRGSTCDLSIYKNDRTVGREHVCITSIGRRNLIQDLNSVNGTKVDGRRLEPGETVEVGNCAELMIAQHAFFVAFDEAAETLWNAVGLASLMSEKTGERLFLFQGKAELGRSHPWGRGAMTARNIGRSHATLEITNDGCTITDHSKTGTFVNQDRIGPDEPLPLTAGDKIKMGDEYFVFTYVSLEKR